MPNPFDQFDAAAPVVNTFDQFDAADFTGTIGGSSSSTPMVNGIPRDIAEDPDLQLNPAYPLTSAYYATPHPGVTPGAPTGAPEEKSWLDRALGVVSAPLRGLAKADVGGGFRRGATSALASTLHSVSDFIDQTIQAPQRNLMEVLRPTVHDPVTGAINEQATAELRGGLADPLGAQKVASESLGVEREINADRAREGARLGGRPTLAEVLADPAAGIEQYSAHLANTGAESVPMMLAAVATRNPELAAGLIGGTTGAQEYTDLRTQGIGRADAAQAGALTGAVETAGEAIGLPFVMGKGGKGSLLRAMLAEGGQEVPVQVAQQNIEDQATGQQTPITQQIGDALDAFFVGAGLGGGGHGVSTATDYLTRARSTAEAPPAAAISPEVLQRGNEALAAPAAPEAPPPVAPTPAAPRAAPVDDLDALMLRNVLPDDAPPVPPVVAPAAASEPVAPVAPAPAPEAPPARAAPAKVPPPAELVEGRREWRKTERKDSRGRALVEPVLDYSRDGLVEWLGANGGADFEELRAQGGADPAALKDKTVMRPFGRVGWPALRKSSGLDLETLREKMQQDGWLPADDPSAPPVVGSNDALDLIMEAINGQTVRHPTVGHDERLERQRNDMRDYEEARDAELATELGFPDASAMYGAIDEADQTRDVRGFAHADYEDALSMADLAERAADAGFGLSDAEIQRIIDDAGPNEADQAAALWQAINRGSDNGSIRETDDRPYQAGPASVGSQEAGAAGRATQGQPGLFPPASTSEEVEAERRRRDDQRDGRVGTARTDIAAGEGELFAGDRPEQLSVEDDQAHYVKRGFNDYLADESGEPRDFLTLGAASEEAKRVGGRVLVDDAIEGERPTWSVVRPAVGRVESSRDMFVPTRGDRAGSPENERQDENRNGRQDGDSRPPSTSGNDAGRLRPRADATPELTRRATNAVDELVRRNRGSVLADTLARDFRANETARLIGQVIQTHADLAAAASVYRNPLFESLHYVFVSRDGTVLGETAISDRMPASSSAFPFPAGESSKTAVDWIKSVMPTGTHGIWLTHNHPSGDPSPSNADLNITKTLDEWLHKHEGPRLLGHVVLNHTTFGQIGRSGTKYPNGTLSVEGADPLREARGHDITGMAILGPDEAAQIGKKIHNLTDGNSVAVVVVDARGKLVLATSFPPEALLAKRGPALLSQLGERSGGLRTFIVASTEQIGGQGGATVQDLKRISSRGLVTDVISVNPDGSTVSLAQRGWLAAKSLGEQSKSRRSRIDRGDRVFEDRIGVESPKNSYTTEQRGALEKAGLPTSTGTRLQSVVDGVRGEWAKIRTALSDTDSLKQAAFDRFHGLRAAEARMGGLPPEESPYLAARLTTGLSSIMESLNLFGAPKWEGGVLSIDANTKGLLDALEPVKGDLDHWLGWMVGRRAQLLKSQGRENLFTDDDIAALLSLADGKEKAFRDAAKGYLTIKNAVLDVAEQAGLIDPVQRAAWDHAEYLPFYRQEGDRALGPGTRRGLSGQTSGIRTLKGGESGLADPMANIMRNFTKLIDASMKNRAMLLAVDKLGPSLFEKQGPAFESALVPMDQVKKHLSAEGVPDSVIAAMPNGALKGVQKMFSLVPPTGDDIVRIMRDGKAEYYKVSDPLVLRALTAFRAPNKTWAIKPFIFAKRLLTTGVTTTAEFVGANLIRDTASTWVIGNDHVRLGVDAANGIVRTLMRDQATKDMMAAGGSFMGGHFYGGDQDATAAALRRSLRKKGVKDADLEGFVGTIARTPLMLWDKWMELSSAIENANRHAVYQAAIRAGKPKAQAIFEAKDLMDFSMQGDSAFMQFFSDVLPFFNARVQGLYKLGRAAADPKTRRRMAARGALLAIASVALWFWNTQRYKDEYDELEEWDKDTYWHIAPGTRWHVRIPKPFEVGLLFGTGPERMMQTIVGNDRAEQTWQSLLRAITGTLAINPIPQAALPIVEEWANRRFFTGRPIENMGDDKLLPEARQEWYTSDTMKLIAAGVGNETGLSPKRLEHLWNGYTGGLGGYVLDASDWLVREGTGAPERPDATVAELPVLGRFLRGDSPKNTRYVTEFYDLREQAQQVSGTIKEYLEAGKDTKAERLERDNAWLLGKRVSSKHAKAGIMYENVRAMEKLVRTLGKERREGEDVMASDASGADKRQQIDDTTATRNDEVRKFVRRLREAQRQGG